MGSLSASLSIATRAMLAEEGAMQASTNNLANTNTAGYSREVPVLEACDPVTIGSTTYGNGIALKGFQSLRDGVLDLRIDQEQQNQGKYTSFCSAMNQVQSLFNDAAGGIGGAITSFFNSVSELSVQPDSSSLRQSLLSSADALADAFHTATTSLSNTSNNLDLQIGQDVDQVNQLTTQIAALNTGIAAMQKVGEDGGTLLDQRSEAISKLSTLLGVSVTQTEDSLTISTANGSALIVGGQRFALGTTTDPSSSHVAVTLGGTDITSQIGSGTLGGLIAVRDQEIPYAQSCLDQLAAQLSSAVNATLATGKDTDGNTGRPLFSTQTSGTTGAAALITVGMSDPGQLALSSTGSAGGNDVANALLALKDQAIVDGQTPTAAYAQIVFRIGSDLSDAQSAQDTSSSILQQLNDQKGSLSGVSVDEETANLMQFQRAFEAAAHIVSVVDSMMKTVLSMGVTQ